LSSIWSNFALRPITGNLNINFAKHILVTLHFIFRCRPIRWPSCSCRKLSNCFRQAAMQLQQHWSHVHAKSSPALKNHERSRCRQHRQVIPHKRIRSRDWTQPYWAKVKNRIRTHYGNLKKVLRKHWALLHICDMGHSNDKWHFLETFLA